MRTLVSISCRFPRRFSLSRRVGGYTLTELLVALAILVALTAIALPMVRSGIRSAHRAGCLSNLKQIGIGLELYLQDHAQVMPVLEAGRRDRREDVPVLETVLAEYLDDDEVFRCPADRKSFAESGSSYMWNTTQNGLRRNQLSFFTSEDPARIPLVIDKEAWHSGGESGSNFLYADMTASNRVAFSVSP
ncbi:MAG: type II secretion system protein [Verrucomicrobiales bacterium]